MTFVARNWARSVKKHGNPIQKFLFLLMLTKIAVMSWVGMKLGRNNVGITPYIMAFKEFLGDENENHLLEYVKRVVSINRNKKV